MRRHPATLETRAVAGENYRDYADFGGVKVPTVQIRNRAGALVQIIIVKDAKPNG